MMIGCVGKDAETVEINGSRYASFSLAHGEKVKGEKRTTWVKVRKLDTGGSLAQWITKGKPIYVEGRPQVSAYTSKDGVQMAEMTIWADRLEFISGTNAGANDGQHDEGQPFTRENAARGVQGGIRRNEAFEGVGDYDEMPF